MKKREEVLMESVATKYGTFECVFEKDVDVGGFSVYAKSVPVALSWGKTRLDAKKNMKDAIEGSYEAEVLAKAESYGSIKIMRSPKVRVYA
jgi:predicted RNase H-like HicB family nuclease